MTPERLQEIRDAERDAEVAALYARIHAQEGEIAALRRGQGTAPEPATPGTTPFHVTHPIPNSRKDTQ